MNVLVIFTDQQRYNSLGCNGNKFARTPNIDRLAAEGTVFSRHIAANPVCTPSRATFLTGLYPTGHNIWSNGIPLNRREYVKTTGPEEEKILQEPMTMADMFAAAGYRTVSFGKLHLTPSLCSPEYGLPECVIDWESGKLKDWHGPYYGFQYVDMTKGHAEQPCHRGHYSFWLRENHPETYQKVKEETHRHYPIPGNNSIFTTPVPYEQHVTNWLADRCCDFIKDSGDQPFFAFVGIPDPHHSFTACEDIIGEFEDMEIEEIVDIEGETPVSPIPGQSGQPVRTREFAETARRYTHAMNYQSDLAVGKIIAALKDKGIYDDTIIIYTGDHGDFLGDHGRIYKSDIGHSTLLHIPFIMRAPGAGLPAKVDVTMSNCDVMATLAALTGVELPEIQHGENILDVIREGREHYALAYTGTGKNVNFTIYDENCRYTYYPGLDHREIFDHRTDPGECHNLIDDPGYAKLADKLQRIIEQKTVQGLNQMTGRLCRW